MVQARACGQRAPASCTSQGITARRSAHLGVGRGSCRPRVIMAGRQQLAGRTEHTARPDLAQPRRARATSSAAPSPVLVVRRHMRACDQNRCTHERAHAQARRVGASGLSQTATSGRWAASLVRAQLEQIARRRPEIATSVASPKARCRAPAGSVAVRMSSRSSTRRTRRRSGRLGRVPVGEEPRASTLVDRASTAYSSSCSTTSSRRPRRRHEPVDQVVEALHSSMSTSTARQSSRSGQNGSEIGHRFPSGSRPPGVGLVRPMRSISSRESQR